MQRRSSRSWHFREGAFSRSGRLLSLHGWRRVSLCGFRVVRRRLPVFFGRLRLFPAGGLLLACMFLLASCENDLSKVNTISSKLLEVSVETSKGITITYSDSAKVKAIMTSPLLLSYKTEEPYDLMPEGLKVVFYDDSLQVESTLTAKYGRRNISEKTMEVRDSVVVVSSDGRKLETERLVWEEEGDRIFSDKFVKITSDGEISQGYGLETNSKFSPYKILKYSGVITVNNEGTDTTAVPVDTAD